MRDLELTGTSSLAAPRFDERAVLAELQDARVTGRPRGVALHDEDVAVVANRDVVGLIQLARTAGLVPFARLSRVPIVSSA